MAGLDAGRYGTDAERNVVGALEAVLFVAGGPVPIAELARVLELEEPLIEAAAERLAAALDRTRGVELRRVAGGLQLVTRPEHAPVVGRLQPVRRVRLSPAALEVLAIVAYRQPVTRAEIEQIRGVDSESPLQTLLEYGLIEEVGRKDAPGRPTLFGTTDRFLEQFGLNDLSDLPPLESFAAGEKAPDRGPLRGPLEDVS